MYKKQQSLTRTLTPWLGKVVVMQVSQSVGLISLSDRRALGIGVQPRLGFVRIVALGDNTTISVRACTIIALGQMRGAPVRLRNYRAPIGHILFAKTTRLVAKKFPAPRFARCTRYRWQGRQVLIKEYLCDDWVQKIGENRAYVLLQS